MQDTVQDPANMAKALVLQFGGAWDRRDVEAILAMLHAEIEYQNVPAAILHGREEVRAFITPGLTAATRVLWEYLAAVASPDGRTVLTERVDTFVFPEGTATARLMGIFEIEDRQIRRWRDYTDLGSFLERLQAIGRPPNPGLVPTASGAS